MASVLLYDGTRLRVGSAADGNLARAITGHERAADIAGRLQRIVAELTGKQSKNEDALEVPPEVLAAAVKLVKLANQYESAAKLIATAIASAKAQ